jgi:hypothetical protein
MANEASLKPWQVANLARKIGCENCGAPIKDTNKYGMAHCGKAKCKQSLANVGVSQQIRQRQETLIGQMQVEPEKPKENRTPRKHK